MRANLTVPSHAHPLLRFPHLRAGPSITVPIVRALCVLVWMLGVLSVGAAARARQFDEGMTIENRLGAAAAERFRDWHEAAGRPRILIVFADEESRSFAQSLETVISKISAFRGAGIRASVESGTDGGRDACDACDPKADRDFEPPILFVVCARTRTFCGFDQWRWERLFAIDLSLGTSKLQQQQELTAANHLRKAIEAGFSIDVAELARRRLRVSLEVGSENAAAELRSFVEGLSGDLKARSVEERIGDQSWTVRFMLEFDSRRDPAEVRRALREQLQAGLRRDVSWSRPGHHDARGSIVDEGVPPWFALTERSELPEQRRRLQERLGGAADVLQYQFSLHPSMDAGLVAGMARYLSDLGFEEVEGRLGGMQVTEDELYASLAADATLLLKIGPAPQQAAADPNRSASVTFEIALMDVATRRTISRTTWPLPNPKELGRFDPEQRDIGGARYLVGTLLSDYLAWLDRAFELIEVRVETPSREVAERVRKSASDTLSRGGVNVDPTLSGSSGAWLFKIRRKKDEGESTVAASQLRGQIAELGAVEDEGLEVASQVRGRIVLRQRTKP